MVEPLFRRSVTELLSAGPRTTAPDFRTSLTTVHDVSARFMVLTPVLCRSPILLKRRSSQAHEMSGSNERPEDGAVSLQALAPYATAVNTNRVLPMSVQKNEERTF